MSEYWMPKPKPEPLDEGIIQEAVFLGVRRALQLQKEETESRDIDSDAWRLLVGRRVTGSLSWIADWSFVTAAATTAIAVKLWFFL